MKEITAKEFKKEVIEGGKVVVDFYSTECPPCEALAPKFEGLEKLYGVKLSNLDSIIKKEEKNRFALDGRKVLLNLT